MKLRRCMSESTTFTAEPTHVPTLEIQQQTLYIYISSHVHLSDMMKLPMDPVLSQCDHP